MNDSHNHIYFQELHDTSQIVGSINYKKVKTGGRRNQNEFIDFMNHFFRIFKKGSIIGCLQCSRQQLQIQAILPVLLGFVCFCLEAKDTLIILLARTREQL
jgi:hypothetical protein